MTRRLLRAISLALLLLLAAPARAELGYPHTGMYGGGPGRGPCAWDTPVAGWPLLRRDGSVDMDVVREIARYDYAMMSLGLYERPDIADSLHVLDSGTKIMAQYSAQPWWNPYNSLVCPDTTRSAERRIYRAVTAQAHWRTYNRCGGFFNGFGPAYCDSRFVWTMLNIGERAPQDAFAAAFADIAQPPVFDGAFVDLWYARYGYMMGDTLDFVRMGWRGSLAAYDSASVVNYDRAVRALAARVPRLIVNGVHPGQNTVAGSMRENFPFQNASGTDYQRWVANMTGQGSWIAGDVGYLGEDSLSVLNVMLTPSCDDSPERARMIRFGITSAALGRGFPVFTCTNGAMAGEDRARYYPEEAAVNLDTRRPSRSLCTRHWLGQAYGPAYEWRNMWRRDFENGIALVNPRNYAVGSALEATYYRIAGSGWPNNGAATSFITVPPTDGIFLLRR